MKKCLVTGGAGYLGSHVCARLLAEGHEVVALDSLQTGRLENIAALQAEAGFTFMKADVRSELPNVAFDELWNLACPASPPHYQRDPVDTMMVNVLGMKNVLDHAKIHGGRVFQASTSEVYGDPEVHPQVETYRGAVNPIGPRACYDEGKRAAETLCFDYHRQFGTEIKVVRIFNTYGPRMHPQDGRVVSNFVVQALKGEDITIFGDGSQTRSFCYVDDLVSGLIALMESPDEVTGPINLGNPVEQTILQLAEMVLERVDSSSKLVRKPLPSDDPTRRRPNIEIAQTVLGWNPTVPIEDGLGRTIDYFQAHLANLTAA